MKQKNTTALTAELLARFDDFTSALNGESEKPLFQLRKEAISAFETLGIPSTKNEEYKFTPIGKAIDKKINVGKPSIDNVGSLTEDRVTPYHIPDLKGNILVFHNGIFSKELSSVVSSPDAIRIQPLSEAYKEASEQFVRNFSKYADVQNDAFTALNTAFSTEGSFIEVSKNQVIEDPIILHFIQDAAQGAAFQSPRNLVLVGENSQVNIVEKFDAVSESNTWTNAVSEVVLEEGANVSFYKVQNDTDEALHTNHTQVYQSKNSTFSAYTFTFSGDMVRNNLNIVLDGEGAEANMYGLYLVKGKSHIDNHTVVDHKQPHANSNELYKGILDESSKGVFNGKIFVRQEAQKTNAFQSNNTILLSDNAVINTKPQLEIWADDVKCSHGCTTGQLDEDALFYLRARGLSKESARAMLLYAFASDVLERVSIAPLKNYLEAIIAERFEQNF